MEDAREATRMALGTLAVLLVTGAGVGLFFRLWALGAPGVFVGVFVVVPLTRALGDAVNPWIERPRGARGVARRAAAVALALGFQLGALAVGAATVLVPGLFSLGASLYALASAAALPLYALQVGGVALGAPLTPDDVATSLGEATAAALLAAGAAGVAGAAYARSGAWLGRASDRYLRWMEGLEAGDPAGRGEVEPPE
jgi:hypothetical protein